jgi:hypothetical protein
MLSICKPDYDAVVEIIECATAFRMCISFATIPSSELADFLYHFPDTHPGVHYLERKARETQDYMLEKLGNPRHSKFDKQQSMYQYAISNVYHCKSFGMELAKYITDKFGIKVRLNYWPGDKGFEKVYSPVRV